MIRKPKLTWSFLSKRSRRGTVDLIPESKSREARAAASARDQRLTSEVSNKSLPSIQTLEATRRDHSPQLRSEDAYTVTSEGQEAFAKVEVPDEPDHLVDQRQGGTNT